MPEEEEIAIEERFKYLRLMKREYVEAGRAERGRFLGAPERIRECRESDPWTCPRVG